MGATFKDTFDLVRITGAPLKKEEAQKTSSSGISTGCFAPPFGGVASTHRRPGETDPTGAAAKAAATFDRPGT